MKLYHNILLVFFLFTTSLSVSYSETLELEDKFNNLILKNHDFKYSYLESRNDIGVFYDFFYDKKKNKIVIKRDENNNPVVRFSLFNFEQIKNGDIVSSFNELDLSKVDDKKIIELHKLSENVKLTVNNKEIDLISKPYKLNDIKLAEFYLDFINTIDTTKGILEISFNSLFKNHRPDLQKYAIDLLEDNIYYPSEDVLFSGWWPVSYINYNEYKTDVDIRNSGDPEFYYGKGKLFTLKSDSGIAQFRQKFDFKDFPFDSQTLSIEIIPNQKSSPIPEISWPKGNASVTFVTPEKGPFLGLINYQNKNILKEIGWDIISTDIVSNVIIEENYYDPYLEEIYPYMQNSINLLIEIKRNSAHYVFKIIIPVFLILCVAWSVMWIPTYKLDARLTTSIVALLALIAYNFVFEGDIPKLEYLTDLDKFILLSYIFCCVPTFISIGFSRFILKTQKLQKRVTVINRHIRRWGGLIYLIISFQIFYSAN